MTELQIRRALERLNDQLAAKGLRGEMCLFGGAVMCLVYHARPDTKDVDAIFRPAQEIRELAETVGRAEGLPEHWLNDAVKGFVVSHTKRVFLHLSNLIIYVPEPKYLLAMKAMSARFDTKDRKDLQFLIDKLELKSADEVLEIVRKYYGHQHIKPATRFFVEELFGS